MKSKRKTIADTLIAALLISGAAICTSAQSRPQRKESIREEKSVLPASQTHESPAKTTERRTEPPSAPQSPSTPGVADTPVSYSYEFTQSNFQTSHVLIEHDWNGVGKITFERKNSDPIIDPLDLSKTTIERLRTLWKALNFLDSTLSYQTEKQYPHLGTMRLQMKQETRDRTAEFNWTTDRDAFALVTEYKRIANQAIFIFDITLARENQPLDAPKLMEQFDAYLRRGEIADAQQLIPLFRELTTDERIPLMARNHAARILKKMEK